MIETTKLDRRFVEAPTTRSARRPLPAEMLRDAARRLSVAALVMAVLWTNGLVLNVWVFPRIEFDTPIPGSWPYPGAPIAIGMILVSLGIAWFARRPGRDAHRILHISLVYEVVVAFAIAIVTYADPIPWAQRPALSFIVIVILLFPMIVPNSPGRTLAAGLAAAAMGVVGMAYAVLRGAPPPNPSQAFFLNLPAFMFAFIAVVPARILMQLGRQVTEARELGAYRLVEKIGEGGMGEVWRAEHRMLARPAAIKLIRPEVLGTDSGTSAGTTLQRFEREALATATLRSPNTIELYDFGIDDAGIFYYVMELLDGFDLYSLVERYGPASPARTAHLLRQACHSLGEAHREGMVHRDVKPANIFACRMGLDLDFVKVLDFGIVKTERGSVPGGDVALTSEHMMSGTPAFMAPEAVTGDREPDHRVDIYALGCVAYWLLTGLLVFEAPHSMQMVLRHVNDEPVPPSRRTELEVPDSLERIILACLAKDPDDRPATARDLDALLADTGLDAGWSVEQRERWWDAHHPPAVLAGSSRG
jgi:serine/threonine-protein kinase